MRAQDAPQLETLTPEAARAFCEEAFRTPPEHVIRIPFVEELRFPGAGGDVPIRVYSAEPGTPRPTLLHYHGGGWVAMSLDTHDDICRRMVRDVGCNVVSIDYRLAPEHKFPGAVDDAYAALRWVADNAERVGADPARLGVMGDSAGGNLAVVAALRAGLDGGPALSACVLAYPAVDANMGFASIDENGDGYMLTKSLMAYFYDHYLEAGADRSDPYLSPLYAEDLSTLPPTLVLTAQYDPLRDEGEAFARRLQRAGVPTTLERADGTIHGFMQFPHLIAQAHDGLAHTAGFVKDAFA